VLSWYYIFWLLSTNIYMVYFFFFLKADTESESLLLSPPKRILSITGRDRMQSSTNRYTEPPQARQAGRPARPTSHGGPPGPGPPSLPLPAAHAHSFQTGGPATRSRHTVRVSWSPLGAFPWPFPSHSGNGSGTRRELNYGGKAGLIDCIMPRHPEMTSATVLQLHRGLLLLVIEGHASSTSTVYRPR
jgi:hypothetical protein